MLAYFVHVYTEMDKLTPTYVLVLFITSVLGAAWAIATIFTYHRDRDNANFVAFIDLCFVGAFIAGVYLLRFIAHENCLHVSSGSTYTLSLGVLGSASVNGLHLSANKVCSMYKACFAFGIMNCVFFFITSWLAFTVGRHHETKTVVRETHYTRHGHRRSGSHRSRRSSHSSRRRAYV